MNISICTIVKNDRARLERLLESAENYGFELVVVDTGSTDGSLELAHAFTDSVYEFPWQDDFALAKNEAVRLAKNDLVLILDSDEWLEEISDEDLMTLEGYTMAPMEKVGRIYRINELYNNGEETENYEWLNRLFDRRFYHYEGRIHEQVVKIANPEQNYDTFHTNIVINHDGYIGTPEQKKEKSLRNIKLLERELEDNPNDPYFLYQIGKSYFSMNENEKAIEYFGKALEQPLDSGLEYVIDMIEAYGYALINSGREGEALGLEGVYDEFSGSADFQFLMGLIYMKNAMFDEALEQFELAKGHCQARMKGTNSYLASYNRGVIYECLEKYYEAYVEYMDAEGYEPAAKRASECRKKIK